MNLLYLIQFLIKNVILTPELYGKISDLMIHISSFDLIQSQKGFSFPNKLIHRAIRYGILRRIGNKQRDIFYQADDIIN